MRRRDKKNDGRRRSMKQRRNGVRRGKRDIGGAIEGERKAKQGIKWKAKVYSIKREQMTENNVRNREEGAGIKEY